MNYVHLEVREQFVRILSCGLQGSNPGGWVSKWVSVVTTKHHDQKPTRGGKGFVSVQLHLIVYYGRKSEQEPGGGDAAEAMEECCLPVCSSGLSVTAYLLTTPRIASPGVAPPTAGPSHINHQPGKCLPKRQSRTGTFSQLSFPLPKRLTLC